MRTKNAMKIATVSFRTSEAIKKKLIAEARKKKVTLSELIEEIVLKAA